MDPLLDCPVDRDTPRVEHPDDIAVAHPRPRRPRRRAPGARTVVGLAVIGLTAGGLWWQQAVTAGPGLVFDGGANVFRSPQGGDLTGIERWENSFGTDVDVAYEPGGKIHGFFGLYNRGRRTVRIEAVPPEGFYYWAFDGAAVSEKWQTASAGGDYTPFRPFTLRPGETRYVRLDFHQATCDIAGLRAGSSRVDSLRVRYRVLGRTRSTDVPFDGTTIAVRTSGVCDRPL